MVVGFATTCTIRAYHHSITARCTTLCDKVCQWFATGQWFSPGTPVSSTNKTDRHNIAEILLKVALSTIKQTNKQTNKQTSKHKHIYLMQGGVNIITNWYIASWCNKTQGLLNFASVEANLVDGYVTPAVSFILFEAIGSLYRATIIHKTIYASKIIIVLGIKVKISV